MPDGSLGETVKALQGYRRLKTVLDFIRGDELSPNP
jgi:hypothetical protein